MHLAGAALCARVQSTLHASGWLELRLAQPSPSPLGSSALPRQPFSLLQELTTASTRALSDPSIAGVLLVSEPGSAANAGDEVDALSRL
eukprot:2892524-Prymnesium_polylepis.1